jgi:hypothetical protein
MLARLTPGFISAGDFLPIHSAMMLWYKPGSVRMAWRRLRPRLLRALPAVLAAPEPDVQSPNKNDHRRPNVLAVRAVKTNKEEKTMQRMPS